MKKNSRTMRVSNALIQEWKKYQRKTGINISFINYTKIIATKKDKKSLKTLDLW